MAQHSVEQRAITAEAANAAVVAAVAKAGELGIRINVAVTDASGVLAAFLRMPGAFLHSVDIAIDKAYTSAGFGFATAQWAGILQGDEALRLGMPTRPRNVVFGGGLPMREGLLFVHNTLVGLGLRDKIRITVQRHEPRLGHVTVSLDAPSGTERMLRFRVDARLEVLPTRPPVSFDARLQLSSNACQVKEN